MQTCFSKTQNQSRVNPWSQRIPHERYCSKNEPESPTPVHLQINDQGKQRAAMDIVPVLYSTIPINDVLIQNIQSVKTIHLQDKIYLGSQETEHYFQQLSVLCLLLASPSIRLCLQPVFDYLCFLPGYLCSPATWKNNTKMKRKQWQKNLQMKEHRIQERKNTKNKVRKEGLVFPKRSSRTKTWS